MNLFQLKNMHLFIRKAKQIKLNPKKGFSFDLYHP